MSCASTAFTNEYSALIYRRTFLLREAFNGKQRKSKQCGHSSHVLPKPMPLKLYLITIQGKADCEPRRFSEIKLK